FTKEPLALGDVSRDGRLVQQPVYARVRKIAAIESQRWRLARVEDAPKDVGIGRRAGRPLQEEHLKVALQNVCIERRELVGSDVEPDADVAQVLLEDGRLEAIEFGVRHFQRQRESWSRTVPVGIGVASLIEQALRSRGVMHVFHDTRSE